MYLSVPFGSQLLFGVGYAPGLFQGYPQWESYSETYGGVLSCVELPDGVKGCVPQEFLSCILQDRKGLVLSTIIGAREFNGRGPQFSILSMLQVSLKMTLAQPNYFLNISA